MTTVTPDLDWVATAADLASMLRVSERTIHRQAASGRIPCHRIGSQVRFTAHDIERILEQRPCAAGPDQEAAACP